MAIEALKPIMGQSIDTMKDPAMTTPKNKAVPVTSNTGKTNISTGADAEQGYSDFFK